MNRPLAVVGMILLLAAGGARAQTVPGVESAPLPPPTAGPSPTSPAPTSPPAAGPPTAGQPAADPRRTLVDKPGDPSDVDEVTLVARPAAVISGQSTWEEAVTSLKAAFKRIEDNLAKAGIRPAGRPIAVFTRTDDDGFSYDALIPVEGAPAERVPELKFGTTPAGRALRFVHKGPYDDIDSTYETITAYLDAKGVLVQDTFVEEYVTDLKDGSDAGLEVNVFALPR